MKAQNQMELQQQYRDLEAEFNANQKAIHDLQAQRSTLQRRLNTLQLSMNLLGQRAVPDYPAWLTTRS